MQWRMVATLLPRKPSDTCPPPHRCRAGFEKRRPCKASRRMEAFPSTPAIKTPREQQYGNQNPIESWEESRVHGLALIAAAGGDSPAVVSCWRLSLPSKQGCVSVVKSHRMFLVGIPALSLWLACAGATVEATSGSGGSHSGGGGSAGGGGGDGGVGGGIINLDLDASVMGSGPDAGSPEALPDLKGYQCDEAGTCTLCQPVRILSLGQPAKYGANSGSTDNTDAFQAFMNSNTKGTATMQMLETFAHITDLDLSNYDVIILQALYTNPYDPNGLWTYSTADAAALHDWVNNKGGAIIAMSGYFSDTAVEIQPLNQLLAPFGITYDGDNTYTSNDCPNTLNSGPLCYCAYGSIPFENWSSLVPDITKNLGKVGIFMGRSITCSGSDCRIVGTNNVDTTAQSNIVGVAKVVGKGRVFAWGDEWVTYTSQWGLTPDLQYDNAATYAQCVGYTPHTSYTVPQFWYNVFRWVAQTTCLTIVVPPTAGSVPQIIY